MLKKRNHQNPKKEMKNQKKRNIFLCIRKPSFFSSSDLPFLLLIKASPVPSSSPHSTTKNPKVKSPKTPFLPMSLTHHRSQVTVNGIQRNRTFHYFWCRICRRTVRFTFINPNENFCPHCFNVLNHNQTAELEPSPASRLLESLALLLNPSIRQRYAEFDPSVLWESEGTNAPWITLHFLDPQSLPMAPLHQTVNVSGGMNENMADLDRPGPPPAEASAIAASAIVKITQEHLIRATNCPVRKDEFEVGGEAKELPCKHLYNSNCIVPWLNMHNTCPICRYVVHDGVEHYFEEGNGGESSSSFGYEDVANSMNWLRNQFLYLRPVRAFSDWT